MICYHGSDTVVNIPKILNAKRPLDFGGGFYVTTNKKSKGFSFAFDFIFIVLTINNIFYK